MDTSQVEALKYNLQCGIKQRPRTILKRERQAGVLIALLTDRSTPSLLLTRRAATLTLHRGEVAFPGGMREESDPDIIHTALREAEEEVGLAPRGVEVIGSLDDLLTVTSSVSVTPVLGIVRQRPVWRIDEGEVARVFEIPLDELSDPTRWRVKHQMWRGREIPVYFFDFDGEVLWGLSAYATLLTLRALNETLPVDFSAYERGAERPLRV